MRVPAGLARLLAALIGRTLLSSHAPISAHRLGVNLGARAAAVPHDLQISRARLPVQGEWLRPANADSAGALLFLHGGGYVIGSPRTHRALAGRIARSTGLPTLVIDYRLAPEHPYPAALEDARAAYEKLIDDGNDPRELAVVGDSAGGGLALALAMSLREREQPLPAVLGLICPLLDVVPDLERSRVAGPREPVLTPGLLRRWVEAYVAGQDPADPLISPLRGDLTGLPPLIVQSAGDDPLLADAENLVVAAASFPGCEIDHVRYDGLWHDFQIFGGRLAEADDAIEDLAGLIQARLKIAAGT